MFVDEALVELYAGDGGDGCLAFRREKYVALGGPFGGNGGNGANIVFEGDTGLNTLIDFKKRRIIKAPHGENGLGKGKYGKNADDVIIKVPLGTVIMNYETNEVIADITKDKEKVIVAKGGKGGRGNMAFATKTNPAPKYAENGEPGEYIKIKLELKLMADVGLVGKPSVGKSTFISKISASKPKIADYPFTTLVPNLGVTKTIDGRSFVVADLPGLIEGASEGSGLGDRFLKHIERTRIIAHLIDMSGITNDPYEDYLTINKELENFDKTLAEKPQILIASKMDMPDAKENLKKFKEKVNKEIYEMSAIKGEGINEILIKLADLLDETPKTEIKKEEPESHIVYKFEEKKPYNITKDGETWIISGDEVIKLFKMIRLDTDEAILRFSNKLRHMGVDDELREKGIKEGDIIKIADYEFEFRE